MRCIAFIGPGDGATAQNVLLAELIAEAVVRDLGVAVITGGLGGVMAAAARGATRAGGVAVGVIPGDRPGSAAPPHSFTIATGMGEARNAVVVNSADAVVSIGSSWGTISEIALARRAGKQVLQIDGLQQEEDGLMSWNSAQGEQWEKIVEPVVAHLIDLLGHRPRTLRAH